MGVCSLFDQTFSADNFRKIFDRENRRGNDVVGSFFPDLIDVTNEIRLQNQSIREFRKTKGSLSPGEFKAQLEEMKFSLKEKKERKTAATDQLLEGISAGARHKSFQLSVKKKLGPAGKEVYVVPNEARSFFVIKQLQRNLNRLYGIQQSNRHQIVCQIRDSIASNLPCILIRTDVEAFYESIDGGSLIKRLNEDQRLSLSSKDYIKQIMRSYQGLSGTQAGLPRGVGISAYLSELYMQGVDREIRAMPGIIYYARYVDDIVAIFSPSPDDDTTAYLSNIKNVIERHGLVPNASKTKSMSLPTLNGSTFECLGYEFKPHAGNCNISIGNTKIMRYRRRIELAFSLYNIKSASNQKEAYRLLVSRMKFLTGNTRLSNSKQHALTGIYFNNSLISNAAVLNGLDSYFKYLTGKLSSATLRDRLAEMSFVDGFRERRFHNFSTTELSRIVKAWKYDT